MKEFLVSPAERPPISTMGPASSLPEKVGSDVLWQSPHGLWGVQRKAHNDLLASVRDGRLGLELGQMVQLHQGVVIIEGTPQYTMDGQLVNRHVQWSVRQQQGVEWAIQNRGVWVTWTRTPAETVACIEHLWSKSQEADHTTSLLKRPGPQRDGWGKLSNRETAIYFMTGIEGVGVELATRLFDHFERSIVGLTVSRNQLLEVPGIGDKKADQIIKAMS